MPPPVLPPSVLPPRAVKVQLRDEVRRFEGVSTILGLLGEAQERFGVPLSPNLRYLDPEGDLLTVSTTGELLSAIRLAEAAGHTARLVASPVSEDSWELVETLPDLQPLPSGVDLDPARAALPSSLTIWVNGHQHVVRNPDPARSLAEFLREDLRLTGTKVACGEGGCGACTVAGSGGGPGGAVVSLNSCLRPLCAMDGWSVTTVEGLSGAAPGDCQSSSASAGAPAHHPVQQRLAEGHAEKLNAGDAPGCCRSGAGSTGARTYHPVQQRLADGHGVQCGFCTPGWVMNMYALLEKSRGNQALGVEEIERHFDGTLCRCTGYRPILQAFHTFAKPTGPAPTAPMSAHVDRGSLMQEPPQLAPAPLHFSNPQGDVQWYSVFTLEQLDAVRKLAAGSELCLVGASTALRGVLKYFEGKPQGLSHPAVSVDISRIEELRAPPELLETRGGSFLRVGAAVSITALIEALEAQTGAGASVCGPLAAHLTRIAGVQVRNVGTWAGNVALARARPAFVSDMAPALAALGASLTVLGGAAEGEGLPAAREVALEGYLLQPELVAKDALIVEARIPLPRGGTAQVDVFRCYKTAHRHANSVSIVNGCFLASLNPHTRVCAESRLFFNGLCADGLLRATAVETALKGQPVTSETFRIALRALSVDVDRRGGCDRDPRCAPAYRLALAKAHLYRFFLALLEQGQSLPDEYSSALAPFATAASRPPLQAKQHFEVDESVAPVSFAVPKLTAVLSTSGEAVYPSDRGAEVHGTLHGAFALSDRANCKLLSVDGTDALQAPGVVGFLSAADVPDGRTLQFDEPLFFGAGELVPCQGAAVGFVVAETDAAARAGALRVRLQWGEPGRSPLMPDLDAARRRSAPIGPSELGESLRQLEELGGLRRRRLPLHRANFLAERHCEEEVGGNAGQGQAPPGHRVTGIVRTGGQNHFYMEPQTCLAIPVEESGLELWTGDQDPAYTQKALAKVLGLPAHKVNVKVRRVGGAFGGKLSRQAPLAAACSLSALKWGRPTFASNERVADMKMVGGREPITAEYDVAFDGEGKLSRLSMELYMDVGWYLGDSSGDLAMAIQWSDNTFFCPSFKCHGNPYTTNTITRTSQRAPGVVQSITAHEVVMEHVARSLGLPFEVVQERNFYKAGQRTPWGDAIGSDGFNWTVPGIWQKLREDADFDARSRAAEHFNAGSRWRKRGIAMTPVKYSMGLNSYRSLSVVSVYADGSVIIAHGGCELGQGIHTKAAQVAASVLGVDLGLVRVADTETSKAPNGGATGGSGTSECIAEATRLACETLKDRLAAYREAQPSWAAAAAKAADDGVCLSAEGWYVNKDAVAIFNYATYGAGVSEVEVDALTGEVEVLRTDILMDLGRQLSAGVDVGQTEGGFVMALGYFFTEQVLFDEQGEQLNLGSWGYKVPSYCDVPRVFNVSLLGGSPNPSGILGSKASAEPPCSLAASAYFAAKFAIYAARRDIGGRDDFFELPIPCTVEEIQRACLVRDEDLTVPRAG